MALDTLTAGTAVLLRCLVNAQFTPKRSTQPVGVAGRESPLLIFCILGWGRGVHVFRLLAAQTAPFQLLAKHQVSAAWGCMRVPSCGAKAVHIPLTLQLFLHHYSRSINSY